MENYNIIDLQEATPIQDYFDNLFIELKQDISDSTPQADLYAIFTKYSKNEITIDTENVIEKEIDSKSAIKVLNNGVKESVTLKTYFVTFPFTGDIYLLKYRPYNSLKSRLKLHVDHSSGTVGIYFTDSDKRGNSHIEIAKQELSNIDLSGINKSIISWNKLLSEHLKDI